MIHSTHSFARRVSRTVALFSLGLTIGVPAWSQDQVTVTATRTATRVNDVVAEVTLIDRAALDRAAGRTLVELLSQHAGLQFASNGGLGKTASLFIRGLESRHTLLMVDGVRVGSATVGTPSLDNLPLEAIDRIEIVRGPMSSLYGNGAFGGVIQIFLRQAGKGLSGHAKLTAGSNSYGQVAGGVGFGNGVVDAAVQVQHTDTKGRSASNPKAPFGNFNDDRDGFRQTGGSARLGWQALADWRLELLALQSTGLTRIDDGPGADARAEMDNGLVSLSARGKLTPGWQTRLSVSDSSDAYDTLASASAFAALGVIKTRSRQLSWENSFATPVGTALALLERTTEKVSRPGAPFAVSDRDIDGLALGLSGTAASHAWQASLRHDRNSQFGGISTGALAYGYAFTPAWRLGASFGTSQVLPSFNQLYFPGFGNPNLLPEEGRHGELSLRWTAGEHSVRAAWYDYRYRGFISSGPAPVNLPRVEIDGVTLAYEGRWRGLDLTAALDHTDPKNATTGNANFGKQLVRRAQQALRLGADWQAGVWSAGATVAAFSHRFDDAANTRRLGGYGTLDLRAEWALTREIKLGLKLNNVGDKAYETVLGYNQPRREGFVTLRVAFP
ncbi:MAG: TonB-dependent receptor [Rubrivivax sp.]|nr:TonB-dependent receptor [Rubrivivax sp.]